MPISDERSGYPYPVKEGQQYINLAAFSFRSQLKRKRDQEAHLNYYASIYNRRRQLSHR